MATYVLPQVLVFQDVLINPVATANPLRAHIAGGHAQLIRYDDEDERDLGHLGYYDNLVDQEFLWPNRPAGGLVDQSYTKLWIKDALLQYFQDTIGSGSNITKVSGYNNRVRSATVNFVQNGEDYPRDAALLDRDVAAGDVVKLRCIDDGDPVTIWTYVKSIIGDVVAASIDAATEDDDNADTQGGSVSVVKTAGAHNCVSLAALASGYEGRPSGFINETYRVIVLEGSVDGDYTSAKLRILSASGEDDEVSVTPAAEGVYFDIGARGLQIRFDEADTGACSASASTDDVTADDLIAGMEWEVTVAQAFTAPVPTAGGTYDGEDTTTYIIEVVEGGLYTASPKIRVTTTNGIDLSGPTVVPAAATAVAVGTKGVTVAFSGTGLRTGDRYYIVANGTAEGPMRTLELGHNMPVDVLAGSEVDVTLFIRKPLLEVPENRENEAPNVNFEMSETEIIVKSGITAFDETWTDGGVEQPLDVYSESSKGYGDMFVEYRCWLSDLCNNVNGISDVGEIDAISGALHPDNPLKWGVFKALSNSNGTEVKYTSVCDPDDAESWADVLELLIGRDDVYGLVPLTKDRTVLDLYAAHVDAMSSATFGLWRVCWVNLQAMEEIPVVHAGSTVPGHIEATTEDGDPCLCVIEDDPNTSGTQYTILRCPASNGNFVTNEVRAGDIVRTLYVPDGFGEFTYSEFVVDEVQSEDQIRLVSGPDAPVNVASKVEIWRNQNATDESVDIGTQAGSYGNKRVRAVWPDRIESAGTIQEGYHLCAALSGLSSGVLPHQGMTHLEIAGFTDVSRTVSKFNRSQLDTMALAGVWIVTQEQSPTSGSLGKVFTRHAVTTAEYDNLNEREEMIVRNVDSISYRFKALYEPYIGVTNVTPSMQNILLGDTLNLVRVLKTELSTPQLGGQLIEGTIVSLEPDSVFKDRYTIVLNAQVPKALNNVELHLLVT
jgi:hypothetical protein